MSSKKELLKRIEDLEERITRLENMHARIVHKKVGKLLVWLALV